MTRYGACHTLIQLQIPSAPHLSWSWHHDGCCRDAQMQEEAQPLRLCPLILVPTTPPALLNRRELRSAAETTEGQQPVDKRKPHASAALQLLAASVDARACRFNPPTPSKPTKQPS